MGFRITANDGNGHINGDAISSYSYSEDVTSLDPSNVSGGTGQVNFTAVGIEGTAPGTNHHNSKLIINNNITLVDDDNGSLVFTAKKASITDGMVSVSGDTLQARLNVEKTAFPHGADISNLEAGDTYDVTLLSAINYYCSLANIVPIFDNGLEAKLSNIPINFIGWKGNLWEHLKMLCSVSSSFANNLNGLEMYISGDELHFREALILEYNFTEDTISESITVDILDAAKSVDVYNYNTSYGTDKVIYEESNYREGADPTKVFKSSIGDPMQVEAGETVTKVFKIDATLETVNQPVCVSTIDIVYPNPYVGKTGQYVVVGTDNLPIMPAQWIALGGKLIVKLTDTPGEIEVTITAPPVSSIEQAAGGTGLAPYKIGVETSGDADYPAFWITGSGVFFNKKKTTYYTGATSTSTSRDSAATVDNPFIINSAIASSRGVAAAQVACGPTVRVSRTISEGLGFGQTLGVTETFNKHVFRVTNAGFSPSNISITQEVATRFSDFNSVWTGKTFADFIDFTLDPVTNPLETLKFNEFSVIPLGSAN